MISKAYLLPACLAFFAAVTGSDLCARMTIAGQSLEDAVTCHLQWALVTVPGIIFLFVPFAGIAVISGHTRKWVKTRSLATLFWISMAVLSAFYFSGFQDAQHASMEESWAAETPWFGPLSFFIGIPLLGFFAISAAILASPGRRIP